MASYSFDAVKYQIPDQTFVPFLLIVFLLSGASLQHTPLAGGIAYASILVIYSIFLLIFVHSKTRIEANRFYVVLFVFLFLFVSVSMAANPTIDSLIRLVALFVFTGVNLFILPKILSLTQFLTVLTRFSAILVVVGFLPYIGITLQTSIVDLSLWGGRIYWYPGLRPITSIYVNPNALGFLLFVASTACLVEWSRDQDIFVAVLFLINFTGLLFTNYRTGWVGFAVIAGLFALYNYGGTRMLVGGVVGLISGILIGLLMMFSIIPGPAVLTELTLNDRRWRWIEASKSFQERPLLGVGFGNVADTITNPHNTYIRMFAATGFFGGVIYLFFFLSALLNSARQTISFPQLTIALLLSGFFTVQMLNQLSFIGISLHSTLIAIILGYHITLTNNYTWIG